MNEHDTLVIGWLLLALAVVLAIAGVFFAALLQDRHPHYFRDAQGRFRAMTLLERIVYHLTKR